MNLVAQFNFFWQKHLEYTFKPLEIAVYFYLLDFCNGLGRKNPFNLAKDRLMLEMGVRTEDPIDTARKRLREAGLILFENGNGRGKTTLYTLLPPPAALLRAAAAEQPKKGAKNTPLSPEDDPPQESEKGPVKGDEKHPPLESAKQERGGERGAKNTPYKGGTTLKKSKEESMCAKSENEGARKKSDFDLFWDAYDKKNGRKAAAQKWAALTPDEQAAILAHAPRYRDATPDKQFRKDPATYLHNRTWEDEELPPPRGGQRPALTPAPTVPPAAEPVPEANLEFLAQQAAAAAARRQAHFAKFAPVPA